MQRKRPLTAKENDQQEDNHHESDPIEFQILNEIGIISQLSNNYAARLLAPELNMSQFIVLNHLVRLSDERSMAQLASAMQVTKGAMSNTIARLHDKGLVAVKTDPHDGRGKRVKLTKAGRVLRNSAVAKLGSALSTLHTCVSAPELGPALDALRKIRAWFDAHR